MPCSPSPAGLILPVGQYDESRTSAAVGSSRSRSNHCQVTGTVARVLTIGTDARRRRGARTAHAGGAGGLSERLRVFLDPADRGRDPRALTRLLESSKAFARTHVQVTDGAVAFAVFAVSFLGDGLARRSAWAGLLTFALALPLAWRRRAPVIVFGVTAVVAFGDWLAGLPLLAGAALLVALYTVAASRPHRAAAAAALIVEGGAVLASVRWGASALAAFASLSGVVVAALVCGLYVRARRAHIAGLVERAARLEFERDQQAQLAAAAERARMSREMHDVVAHNLAVMVSLANGATAKLGRDPQQSREALESIAEIGRQALADTRQLLSALRTGDCAAQRPPQPGIEQIADLVARAAATGLAATLTISGDPVPVAAGPALSAYRIVQEAITNAVKHAVGATTVAVELAWTPGCLDITVTDDGHGNGQAPGVPSGLGLAGMRERAALCGGTATAGPGQRGGWTVTATIPVTGPLAS
jgi:signal transduction histidine kinase